MLEPEMEAYLLRLVPGLERQWQGANDEEIEEIEELADQELPTFYRWFLSKMGRSAGPLDRYLGPYSARTVLTAYASGDVDAAPPMLLIAHVDDPMMPLDLFYDLGARTRGDAAVLRGLAGDGTKGAETLREWLGWILTIGARINPSPQRCTGTFKASGGDAAGQLASVLEPLGFTAPIPTGPYCKIYERPDVALACKVDAEPSHADLLCFDLGGPDIVTLRRILGDVATQSDIAVADLKWTPPVPKS